MTTDTQPTATTTATDLYLDMVRAFPLRPIKSADEHDRAIATLYALDDRRGQLQPEEHDYFLVLALLIEYYEDKIYADYPNGVSTETTAS